MKLFFYSTACCIALSSIAVGQVFTPSTSSGQSNSKPVAKPANNSSSNSGANSRGSNSLFEGFNFDPTTNVAKFNGTGFNVKDNDIFRARFEKFLNSAESGDENSKNYQKALNDVLKVLGPRSGEKDKIFAAIARLEYAAAFEEDSRLCDSIINATYRLYLTKRNSGELKRLNEVLDRERRGLDWNLRTVNTPAVQRGGGDGGSTVTVSDAASESERARIAQRIVEKEKERVSNLAKMNLSEVSSRIEFQSLMVQFFLQRRFEHVIISTRIYTEFYQDGSGKLDSESNISKTFAETLGYSPTVNTLDSLSNEMIREVKQQVESFLFQLSNDEIDGATRQLQQTFLIGEHLPVVQNIERDKKRKIQKYARNGFQLVSAIEAKDYNLAGDLVEQMREQAVDFDHSKPSAVIKTSKLTSDMKLTKAKNAAAKGDDAGFERYLTEATEIWPLNPNIQTGFQDFSDGSDKIAEARRDFDKLLSQGSYRQIYDNKERFLIANHNDIDRAADLKQVVENVTEIEIALEQAKKLKNTGSDYAAWELLSEKFDKYPDDIPLATQLTKMTHGVSNFAEALNNARELQEKKQHGSSLAWYLTAKKIFPQSSKAQKGIEELVDIILPE